MRARLLIVCGTVLLLAFPGGPKGQQPGAPLTRKTQKVALPQKQGHTKHTVVVLAAAVQVQIVWHKKAGETDHFTIAFQGSSSPCQQGMTIQEDPSGGTAECDILGSASLTSYLYDVQKVDPGKSVNPCRGCGSLDLSSTDRRSEKAAN